MAFATSPTTGCGCYSTAGWHGRLTGPQSSRMGRIWPPLAATPGLAGGAVEVGHRLGPGVVPNLGAGRPGVLVAVLEMDPAVLARQPGLFGRRAEVGPGIGLAGAPGWVAVRGSTLELTAGMVTLSSKLPRPVKP